MRKGMCCQLSPSPNQRIAAIVHEEVESRCAEAEAYRGLQRAQNEGPRRSDNQYATASEASESGSRSAATQSREERRAETVHISVSLNLV